MKSNRDSVGFYSLYSQVTSTQLVIHLPLEQKCQDFASTKILQQYGKSVNYIAQGREKNHCFGNEDTASQ